MALIKGRDNICEYVGEDTNLFTCLREKEALPVWRRSEGARWRALTEHLDNWLREQAEKLLCVGGSDGNSERII